MEQTKTKTTLPTSTTCEQTSVLDPLKKRITSSLTSFACPAHYFGMIHIASFTLGTDSIKISQKFHISSLGPRAKSKLDTVWVDFQIILSWRITSGFFHVRSSPKELFATHPTII